MSRLVTGILILVGLLTTLGCGMGIFNPNGAIVEDKLGHFRTLAVTAERRVIMFNDEKKRYCAEPPPDVAQNISSALRIAADATGKGIDAGAQLSKAMGISVQRLMNRSQGLQLYRDGMYFLCQGFMNGVVNDTEFATKSNSLLQTAHELIKHEITVSNGNINAAPTSALPSSPTLPPGPSPSGQ